MLTSASSLPKLAGFVAAASVMVTVLAVGAPQRVEAQVFDPQRNCQTVRSCRFERGGSFRGCVSSFSCRTCSFEAAKCTIGGSTGPCRKQVCRWG